LTATLIYDTLTIKISRRENMVSENIKSAAKVLNTMGVPGDYGPDISRLLIRMWREVAKGKPVTKQQVEKIIAELSIPKDKAEAFLRQMSERDDKDNIIGIFGLSQVKIWHHHLKVNGVELRTWCAWDTLFLAQTLKQTVEVESESPLEKKTVKVTISPNKVEKYVPATAVLSMVMLDPQKHDVSSLEKLWNNVCCKIFYCASREEAEKWEKGMQNMTVITIEDGFDLGREAFAKILKYV
jgi:alkylmercury lyase